MLKTTRWGSLLLATAIIISGCTNMGVKSDHPELKAADGTPLPNPPQEISSFRVSDPEPPPIVDKELDSAPPEMQPKVEQWIAYFQGKGRPHMERYLSRSTRYIQLMKRIMRQNGLPEDLVYIALIESGFSSRATSRAAAVGYWQFIKGTGRRYGLEVNAYVDERRDPVLSTQAAAEYFKGLYSVFGSWYLSMASYNVGENRVKKEVMAYFTRDFWELARKRRLPKETVNYIPKFIAARLIALNPEKYGFSDVDFEKPAEFELIKVDKPVNLRLMAGHMNMEYEDLKLLNPKFKGEVAPTKITGGLEIRVPVGDSKVALAAAQSSVPERLDFVADSGETETYKVRPGDSLYTIARRYHTTIVYLRDANDLKAGKKLRIGMRLQVPDRSGGAARRSKTIAAAKVVPAKLEKIVEKSSDDNEKAASNPELVTSTGVFYIVQQGDTLSSIAEEYDSSIRELKRMNKLGHRSMIRVGMKLKVPKDEGLPSTLDDSGSVNKALSTNFSPVAEAPENSLAPGDTVNHTVKAGENLTTIARRYGVTVQQLRQANNLKRRAKISSGMTLLIPVKPKPSGSVDRRRISSKGAVQVAHLRHHRQRVHVVRRGENLSHIANRYQVSVDALKRKNRLHNESRLFIGARLLIPEAQARTF